MGINYIKPSDTKKVVSMKDDAIDREKSSMEDYAKEYDIKHLVFLEGQTPDYFVINNILSSKLVEIQQEHYVTEMAPIRPGATVEEMKKNKITVRPVRTGEMIMKYFKFGCAKMIIEGKEVAVDEDFIETIPPEVLQEIGSYVMMRSTITESKKK